jgi:hypothetical protein
LIRVPLSRRRSVFRSTVAAGRIAPEFTGDRGWGATKMTSNGSYAATLRAQDRDLLTFGERKIAP